MSKSISFLGDPAKGLVKEVRKNQLSMAGVVDDVISKGGTAVIEGPVGCGKSYAYLVPIILAGGRAVISTAKKSLQDQIVNKDIPAISKALGKDVKAAVAKGKATYVCPYTAEQRGLIDARYLTWARSSRYGDRAEYTGQAPRWAHLATAEQCVSKACPYFSKCGYIQIKKEIADAQIVVTNHNLLGQELKRIEPTYFGPKYNVLIVDEAHKLVEGLRSAFSHVASEHLMNDVVSDLKHSSMIVQGVPDMSKAWKNMFTTLLFSRGNDTVWTVRPPAFEDAHARDCFETISDVKRSIVSNMSALGLPNPSSASFWETFGPISANLSAAERSEAVLQALACGKLQRLELALSAVQGLPVKEMPLSATAEEKTAIGQYNKMIEENNVVYAKLDNNVLSVNATPVNMGPLIAERLKAISSLVITSATLAIGDSFNHLSEEMGVKPTHQLILPHTFDYHKQALLFIPKDIAPPGQATTQTQYLADLASYGEKLIVASKGNAFFLFTSTEDMNAVAATLTPRLEAIGIRCFVQGRDGQAGGILTQFLATDKSVLFGLKSFWEGVDVQGEKLRLVIIAKLPFPQEKDPVVAARKRKHGDQAFHRVNMTDMIIDLKQGAGRLIRSKEDRGVVALLDSRIWTKQYGQQVIRALPFTQRTSDTALTLSYLGRLAK